MTISVVIPFYNESESIHRTLFCIDNQEFPPSEVIFVDSGSTDNTVEIIKTHIDLHNNLSLIRHPQKSACKNQHFFRLKEDNY